MSSRGRRLVEAMHRRGIYKQHALAHLLGVKESTISRWKNDEAISVDHAVAVCAALSISMDWFLCGIGPIDRPSTGDYADDVSIPRAALDEPAAPYRFEHILIANSGNSNGMCSRTALQVALCASYNH